MQGDSWSSRRGDSIATEVTRRRVLELGVGATVGSALVGTVGANGGRSSGGGTAPRPGPAYIYDEPATPPQFENAGVWQADPLLVCGADAYVDGEYLYQSFPFDDSGADDAIEYPTDEATYGFNAADILEVRTTLVDAGIKYRVTLNTMLAPDVAGIALGIDTGGDGGENDWGYGLGTLGDLGLDHVVVTWGTGAELDGEPIDSSVDLERNQIEVTVPLEPGEETWRHYAVAGLFDADGDAFKQVQPEPTATHPGGPTDVPPVFSVAFRSHEQEPLGGIDVTADDPADQLRASPAADVDGTWRTHAQSSTLAERDISAFHADVDFGRLAAGETEVDVPRTGYLNLLYGSRFDLGEGIDPDGGPIGEEELEIAQPLLRVGRVQPYAVYVPESALEAEASRVHLHLHSLGGNLNQYGDGSPNALRQFGEERDAIVLTPEGRGPGTFYYAQGALDVFEALSAVDSQFGVDFDLLTIGGYSMGGYGTFKLIGEYPDLFASAFSIVGDAIERQLLDNIRHVPLLMWNAVQDELVDFRGVLATHGRLDELGYRHEFAPFEFQIGDFKHGVLAGLDEWDRGRDFLDGAFIGEATVERQPARVTYTRDPALDVSPLGLVPDGAYWISRVSVADGNDTGHVEAFSEGLGETPPIPEPYEDTFHRETLDREQSVDGVRWREPARRSERPDDAVTPCDVPAERFGAAPRNVLLLDLEGVSALTVHVEDAGLDPARPLRVRADSTAAVDLTLQSTRGSRTVTLDSGCTRETVHVAGPGRGRGGRSQRGGNRGGAPGRAGGGD